MIILYDGQAASRYRSQKRNTILLGVGQEIRAVGLCLWMGGVRGAWSRQKARSCVGDGGEDVDSNIGHQ